MNKYDLHIFYLLKIVLIDLSDFRTLKGGYNNTNLRKTKGWESSPFPPALKLLPETPCRPLPLTCCLLSSAEGHTNTKQALETQGTYSDSVSWDRRASKTYWLRLQAKHDESGWYNPTKEFAGNEKLAHLISQGGMIYKSKEPMEGLSPCLSLSHMLLDYALHAFLMSWLT